LSPLRGGILAVVAVAITVVMSAPMGVLSLTGGLGLLRLIDARISAY